VVYVMAARSGRWKGIFAVHHWLVLKPQGATRYERYDVVGWGSPVRKDNYPADGRWYSSEPQIVHEVRGVEAQALIPKLRAAVESYPWGDYGDYIVWPGPNSNSFVAHIARAVPELGAELDPAGIGKDWLGPGLQTGRMPSGTGWQVSWHGLIGAGASWREGVELHLPALGSTGWPIGANLAHRIFDALRPRGPGNQAAGTGESRAVVTASLTPVQLL
jgi:hypothetical protein